MAKRYFAGYLDGSFFIYSDRSLIKEGNISRILIDEGKKHILTTGRSLSLEEEYSLKVDEISRDGNAVMLTLLKEGEEITTDIVSDGDTFLYEVDVNGTDLPIIMAHIYVLSWERSKKMKFIFIDGLFQISDGFVTIEKGDTHGIMEIISISSSSIVLENKDSFSLIRGDTVNIMDGIKFKVADSNDVRFYPFREISNYYNRPGQGSGRGGKDRGQLDKSSVITPQLCYGWDNRKPVRSEYS